MSLTISPDWSEGTGTEPVQPGSYTARIDSYVVKQTGPNSKTPGTNYLNWKLVIFGAEGAAAKENNRPVFLMTFHETNADWAKRRMNNLIESAFGGERPSNVKVDDLIGRELQVLLKSRIQDDGTPGMPEVSSMKPIRH